MKKEDLSRKKNAATVEFSDEFCDTTKTTVPSSDSEAAVFEQQMERVATAAEQSKTVPSTEEKSKTGVVTDCVKLNIRQKPKIDAAVLCTIDCLTEVVIDEKKSTKEFYKISTAAGAEGYCMRKYIASGQ